MAYFFRSGNTSDKLLPFGEPALEDELNHYLTLLVTCLLDNCSVLKSGKAVGMQVK